MGFESIAFAVDVFFAALFVGLAAKYAFVKIKAKDVLLIVTASALVSLLPVIGWVLGLVLFIYLLHYKSGCSVTDALFTALLAKVFSFLTVVFLLPTILENVKGFAIFGLGQ